MADFEAKKGIPPEQAEEGPAILSIDYWKQKLQGVGKSVEQMRRGFTQDDLDFMEMDFGFLTIMEKTKTGKLEDFVSVLDEPLAYEKGVEKAPNVKKTASQMADELPDSAYSPEEKKWIRRYVKATSNQESGHHYNILGSVIDTPENEHQGTRALGRYQIMPKNWIKWSKEVFSRVAEPTPQAQEYVAFKMFMKNYDELKQEYPDKLYRLFYSMASRWHGAGYKETILGKKVPAAIAITHAYAKKVLADMQLKPTLGDRATQSAARVKHGAKEAAKEGKKIAKGASKKYKAGKKILDKIIK